MHGTRVEHERNHDGAARGPAVTPAPAQATPAGGVAHATSALLRLQALAGNHATAAAIARTRAGDASPLARAPGERGTPPESRVLQRLAYDDPPAGWGTVTIKRSKEGAAGVYFIDSGTDRIVVKPLAAVATTDYADKLMQAMGLDAPLTKTYRMASTEGQQIATLLTTGPVHGTKTPTETQDVIAKSSYFLVMSNVEGKSIQRLDDGGAAEFIQNDAALASVGKIMVADAFLGNWDRLIGSMPNLGNFFYAVATATAPGVVRTIDNDSAFKPVTVTAGALTGNLKSKLKVIEKLIDKTNRSEFIDDFLEAFRKKQKFKGHATAVAAYKARIPQAQKAISDGIDAGLNELANIFATNIDLVREVAFSRERESKAVRNPDEAKGLAHYIRARRLEGTTETKAVAQLTDYVKYRDRRNKALPGMKWVTKMYSDVGFSFA